MKPPDRTFTASPAVRTQGDHRRRLVAFTCEQCGATFHRRNRPSRPPRFCSKSCVWLATKGPAFNARIARETNAEKNARRRGTGTKGYVKRNGRHEHRIVAEEMLGRPLRKGEIVHHIDHDKHNNNPENLEIITQAEHMRRHGLGIPGKPRAHTPSKARGKRGAHV